MEGMISYPTAPKGNVLVGGCLQTHTTAVWRKAAVADVVSRKEQRVMP